MKALAVLLAFSILLGMSKCGYIGANVWGRFSVYGPNDPDTCDMMMQSSTTKTAEIFSQWGTMGQQTGAGLTGCQYQNLVLYSFFHNDQLNTVLPIDAPVNNSVENATLNSSILTAMNGTACVYLPQSNFPENQYLCLYFWQGMRHYAGVWGTGKASFKFDINHFAFLVPNYANIQSMTMMFNWVLPNTSFPLLRANLTGACGIGSVVTALTQEIIVSDSTANYSAVFPNMTLSHILVKKVGQFTPGVYLSVASTNANQLFQETNGCYSMGMTWADVLPSMKYCSGGCQVSLLLIDWKSFVYNLQTFGVTTNKNGLRA